MRVMSSEVSSVPMADDMRADRDLDASPDPSVGQRVADGIGRETPARSRHEESHRVGAFVAPDVELEDPRQHRIERHGASGAVLRPGDDQFGWSHVFQIKGARIGDPETSSDEKRNDHPEYRSGCLQDGQDLRIGGSDDDAPVRSWQAEALERVMIEQLLSCRPADERLERPQEAAHRPNRQAAGLVLKGAGQWDGQLGEFSDAARGLEAPQDHVVVANRGGAQASATAIIEVVEGRLLVGRKVHPDASRPACEVSSAENSAGTPQTQARPVSQGDGRTTTCSGPEGSNYKGWGSGADTRI